MIVLSNTLVLSEVQVYGADNPIVGWHNIVSAGLLTADTEAAGFPVGNLANPNTSLEWRGADAGAQTVALLTDAAAPLDYIAVARHNFGSAAIALSVEGRASAGAAAVEIVQPAILADDAPVIFRFAPRSLYEIILRLQPGAAPPRAAVLYAGKLLVMERGLYVDHTPLKFARKTSVVNGRAESGDFLGRIVIGEYREAPAKFMLLDPDWYRAQMEPFLAAAQERPFFFGWRPQTYPRESGFAVLINDPQPVPSDPSHLIEIELQMRGIS
jgi:hypothetical protein